MVTISLPDLNERLVVPAVSSSYPTLGTNYKQGNYEIDYASGLVRTGKNYYDSKAQILKGYRMSTAGEELVIQLALERAGQDPRKAEVFKDLFARGPAKVYIWQLTETFLRTPNGKQNPDKPDYIDPQGRKYWVREFDNGNEVVGAVCVPEGSGRVVPKTKDLLDVWDPITGLPRVTSDYNNDEKYNNHATHFWFNPMPVKDNTSGYYDVAVGRLGLWPHGGGEMYLSITAYHGRLFARSFDGFRLVREVGPEDRKLLIQHK